MEKKVTSHVTKGLIISLIMIVLSTIFYFLDMQQESWTTYLQYAILLAGIIWACISYGKDKYGNVTFGNIFAHGFKTSVVITCISIVFSILFIIVFPEIKEKGLEAARVGMEQGGQMSDSQIDQSMEMADRLFYAFLIGGIIFVYLIIGVIASLIGAGLTKKNPPTPFENQV